MGTIRSTLKFDWKQYETFSTIRRQPTLPLRVEGDLPFEIA